MPQPPEYPNEITVAKYTVPLTIKSTSTPVTAEEVKAFPPFRDWVRSLSLELESSPIAPRVVVKGVEVTDCDRFGPKLGFVKFRATVEWTDGQGGKTIPGIVFARGGAVAVLVIITPENNSGTLSAEDAAERVVLAIQPRIPAGVLAFAELPAGMLDGESHMFAGAAARELEEECGITINESDIIDMTDLALGPTERHGTGGESGCAYTSPGGSDEWIKLFLCRKTLSLDDIKKLEGKKGGLVDEGERIEMKIVKLSNLWKATRDMKALSAVALYEGLKREGKL
ncbi:hypothetical protein HK104_002304 [Borealophlyctis nickersoniae]|nr:hypothetical protein HK104_002304 [Borealophlyctis nickersoniae]